MSARRLIWLTAIAVTAACSSTTPTATTTDVGTDAAPEVDTTSAPDGVGLATDFEDGLDGWEVRVADDTPATVSLSDDAHGGTHAALVSERDGQGDGIGHDVTEIMPMGGNFQIEAWVKMADGAGGDIWLTVQRVTDGADSFDNVGQYSGVADGEWVHINETYRMAGADTALLYFETDYPDGTAASFLVDDIVITPLEDAEIQTELAPIKDTVEFGMGVAIDSRETTGPAAQLTNLHFDQLTPENHMKPEAWYDADRNFRVHPETVAMMDFAAANDLNVYGHVLVWHSQTPDWFFQRDDGTDLTSDPADQEILRDRMRTHIFAIAEALRDGWGEYGGGNPLVAWDVVNEVISDSWTDDGLRRSRWYDVLGEDFVDLAFEYAEEAFNETYAAEGTDRPVALAINDYNTEQAAKRAPMIELTERLLERGAPVDIFGHQFHLNLSVPTQTLEDAIVDAQSLGLQQVVSELDVTTGTPVTEALLIGQGDFYRDAFDTFRSYADDLFSVTLWGLTDNRSWRVDNGDPLVFDDDYQAKPAYCGIVVEDVPSCSD